MLPVIRAVERWLRLTGKVWLFYSDLKSTWNCCWVKSYLLAIKSSRTIILNVNNKNVVRVFIEPLSLHNVAKTYGTSLKVLFWNKWKTKSKMVGWPDSPYKQMLKQRWWQAWTGTNCFSTFQQPIQTIIHCVSKKKQDTKLLPITSPNVNRFSKFFQWQTHW